MIIFQKPRASMCVYELIEKTEFLKYLDSINMRILIGIYILIYYNISNLKKN